MQLCGAEMISSQEPPLGLSAGMFQQSEQICLERGREPQTALSGEPQQVKRESNMLFSTGSTTITKQYIIIVTFHESNNWSVKIIYFFYDIYFSGEVNTVEYLFTVIVKLKLNF